MSDDSKKAEHFTGCMLGLWSMFITSPLWLVMFYLVLDSLGDSINPTVWVLFFIYAPAHILGIVLTTLVRIALFGLEQ